MLITTKFMLFVKRMTIITLFSITKIIPGKMNHKDWTNTNKEKINDVIDIFCANSNSRVQRNRQIVMATKFPTLKWLK